MSTKKQHIFGAFINVIAYLATITVNALANILPLFGKSTGDLSDSYPNLFVPSGLTFSIWAVIYLLLGGFVVYGLIKSFAEPDKSTFIEKIGPFFLISSIANCLWIFAWHGEMVFLSLCCMFVILASLIILYTRLNIGKEKKNWQIKLFVELPISIYLGWITVATIANITALLVNLQWGGWGLSEVFWTVVMISAAIIIALLSLFLKHDIGFSLVVLWALFGIYIKRIGVDMPPDKGVEIIAFIGMIVIVLAIVTLALSLISRKRKA